MGLRQDFRFKYDSKGQVVQLLRDSASEESLEIEGINFSIKGRSGSFTFHGRIEPFGIRCDRSGKYFEFLGKLIELITGEFGAVEIEDVP